MEEARMAIAENLKVTNRVDDKVDKVDGKVDKVDGKVDKVGNKVDKMGEEVGNKVDKVGEEVGDKVVKVGEQVDKVDNKVTVLIEGTQMRFLWLLAHSRWCTWLDVKEANERSAVIADEEKRSYSDLDAVDFWGLFILTENLLREKSKNWLSPPDPSTNHNIARKAHHKGTASWFFQSRIYEQWKSSPSFIWIHGKRTRPFLFASSIPTDSYLCSRLGQKRPVVCHFLLMPPGFTQIIAQLWYN
jgi:hypothetical protein